MISYILLGAFKKSKKRLNYSYWKKVLIFYFNLTMWTKFQKELANNREISFKVKVIPQAPKTDCKAIMADGTLKIAVTAAPESGRANQALIKFLAQQLAIDASRIIIISGQSARLKLVRVRLD